MSEYVCLVCHHAAECCTCSTEVVKDALAEQVGGDHYKDFPIQPMEFIQRNKLTWCEGNVVKLVCRHRAKGGKTDLEKAIHYLRLLMQLEYPAS